MACRIKGSNLLKKLKFLIYFNVNKVLIIHFENILKIYLKYARNMSLFHNIFKNIFLPQVLPQIHKECPFKTIPHGAFCWFFNWHPFYNYLRGFWLRYLSCQSLMHYCLWLTKAWVGAKNFKLQTNECSWDYLPTI